MSKKLLSIVLPSYNEEANIPLVYNELLKHIDKKSFDYEIIFVNDGSVDNTWDEIEKLAKKNPLVKGINFSRNFGHHAALEAGLIAARGDIVVTMDSDLQHPPSLIPDLIEKWRNGADIVSTVRTHTVGVSFFKAVSSGLFYKMLNSLSELELKEGEADYRLLSRRALNSINSLSESPKFYRGIVNWVGFNTERVEYTANERIHGKSSYSLKKMIELARLGITSFSMKPLKLIFSVGIGTTLLSFFALVLMIIVKIVVNPDYFSNNAILVTFLILITGILTTFQGVIAVYLVDIFHAAKNRPTYIIKDSLNDKDKTTTS